MNEITAVKNVSARRTIFRSCVNGVSASMPILSPEDIWVSQNRARAQPRHATEPITVCAVNANRYNRYSHMAALCRLYPKIAAVTIPFLDG